MAELNTNNKLNNAAGDLPAEKKINLEELPRDPEGKIIMEDISTGKTEKGNFIVPDDILQRYYKELPNGTTNESKTFTAFNRGLLKSLNEEIRRKGAEALNAERAQRRTNREILEDIAKRNTPIEELERLGLESGDMLLAANYAAVLKAIRGDIKALEYIRDTLGEKPATEVNATVEEITQEDRELLQRVADRLDIHNRTDL